PTLFLGLSCAAVLAAAPGSAVPQAQPVPKVKVAKPIVREVTDYEDFIGRLEPAATVEIRPRVTGFLTKVTFRPGTTVHKGDVLFEIDERIYVAELDVAKAVLTLQEAKLELAKLNNQRVKE